MLGKDSSLVFPVASCVMSPDFRLVVRVLGRFSLSGFIAGVTSLTESGFMAGVTSLTGALEVASNALGISLEGFEDFEEGFEE